MFTVQNRNTTTGLNRKLYGNLFLTVIFTVQHHNITTGLNRKFYGDLYLTIICMVYEMSFIEVF